MGKRGMRVGTAVTLLAFGGALLAALPLQLIWWRTAEQSSLQLVDALSEQIATTVRREWWDRVVQAEAAYDVAASLQGYAPDDAAAARALRAALTASQVPSAITYGRPGGGSLVARRTAAGSVTLAGEAGAWTHLQPGPPRWREASDDFDGGRAAVAYGALQPDGGALSVYIGFGRFAELVGAIPVGRTGGAFVVDPGGAIKVPPAEARAERLKPAVEAAVAVVAARPKDAVNIVEARRLVAGGERHRVSFSPLEFNGWQFVVVVPEAEFLGEIERTQRRTLVGLLALAAALGLLGALLARRVLSRPVAALTADLAKIERFDLEAIGYRPGRLREFDQLSAAIARMAQGLADFAKFIPTDLVRMLLADGVRAAPGGETRRLTVMFADVAGFTKLSERMGTAVIGVVSRYLDVVSHQVESNGGAVDKFIGDAVMALWGAPRNDPDQARNACLAALGAIEAVRSAGIVDDEGKPLRIRIGIHSGAAVVGNIGSARRLNYTAIGDTVNLASRLEGANKVFGTAILISEATRAAAGAAVATREVAEIAVFGKAESVRVHELLGSGGAEAKPDWARDYERALEAYRRRRFATGIRILDGVLKTRPDDGPSIWLKDSCRALKDRLPPAGWRGVAILDVK